MISERRIKANIHAQSFVLTLEDWVQKNLFYDFKLTAKFDWDYKRRSSRGGIYKTGPGINIAMYYAVPDNNGNTYRFFEYASFDANPYIGGFYSTDPYNKLEAIIAHEVAHAVQFFSYKKLGTTCKPHGPVFKKYYKVLREEFVNKFLPAQDDLRKDYEGYMTTILGIAKYL